MIVVDCSYTLALVMPDEARPASVGQALAGRLFVPTIWAFEVANALRNSVRRGRLGDAEVPGICSELEQLEVELVQALADTVRPRYAAAQVHGLTAYDAAYLDLALQRRCALATLDQQLAAAATRAGISVLD